MKIIGTLGANQFLVSMTQDEVANVIGLRWASSASTPPIRVGLTFDIGEQYRRGIDLRDAQGQIEKAASVLRAVADAAERQITAFYPDEEPRT